MRLFVLVLLLFVQLGFSQTLRDTTNQYDYIIITVPEFVNSCETFKSHKETARNFKVLIANTAQIFNEFNSKEKPEDNIRDFISYAGTYWKEPVPKYFLFAGNINFIPNHVEDGIIDSFYTDYFYSKNSNDSLKNFFIGRVPSINETELQNYFNKVISYESNVSFENWNNRSLFVSASDSEGLFRFDSASVALSNNMDENIERKYIFRSPDSPYAGNKDSLINFLNSEGAAVAWFIGHSIDRVDFGEPIFLRSTDTDEFQNDKYFFMIMIGCQDLPTDTSYSITAKLINSEHGALGAFVPIAPAFYGSALGIFNNIAPNILDGNSISIAELISQSFGENIFGIYSRKIFHILGDPSIILKQNPLTSIPRNAIDLSSFDLEQNYPNPFNPSTTISFTIPNKDFITIKVFSPLGDEVAVLSSREFSAGKHSLQFDGSSLSSGIYFYTLLGTNFSSTKKMILMK